MIRLNRRTGRVMFLCTALLMTALAAASLAQQAAPGGPAAAPAPAAPGAQGAPAAGAPAQAGEDGTTKKTAVEEDMSFLQLLVKGGWFMVPIAICSLVGLALIFERLVALRRGAVIPRGFMPGLEAVYRDPKRDAKAALDYCHKNRSPIARVIAVGIRNLPRGIEAIEQGIEDAGANEVAKLRRNLRLLFGVSAVSPMLGLLGTVWGMIEAFREAASKGLGQAQNLAGGIYIALVTTLAGLMVAIPILIFYYFFLSKIDTLVSEMNEASEGFIERFVNESNAESDAAPAPAPRATAAATAPPPSTAPAMA